MKVDLMSFVNKKAVRVVLSAVDASLKEPEEFQVRKKTNDEFAHALDLTALEKHRLEGVIDTLPALIYLVDSNFNVQLTNKSFNERFGDAKGKKCYAHLFGRKTPCPTCQTPAVFETKTPRRWEWRGPDGRDYNIYDFIFKDADGTILVLKMAWDITERKRAEEAFVKHHTELESQFEEQTKTLIESEERFRLALKNTPVSVSVQDRNLKYIWAYDRNKINPKEIIGKTDFDLFSPEDAEYLTEIKRRVLEIEKDVHEKLWLNWGGRKYFDLFIEPMRDASGKVTGIGITSVDLTQMKLAQEAVTIAKDEWERTFDSVPDLIAIIDKNHKIVAANKAMAKRMKLHPKQCIGLECFSCVHKTSDPINSCPHCLTLRDKKQHMAEIHEDNLNGDFLISTTPLFDAKGELTGSVHVARDITDAKKSQLALQNLLKDKETLLREVHHRVKNNLQIIYSLMNMQSRRTDNTYIKNALEDGKSRIKSMALINEILYKSENVSKLDVAKYLNELVSYLRETYKDAGKVIDVKVDIESIPLGFDAAISCGLIVNELVSNSLKYAFTGRKKGTVIVKLRKSEDCTAILTVEDDGKGLPKGINVETLQSLGLHLVSSLTKQLDGRMEIKTNKGTKFKITIPL